MKKLEVLAALKNQMDSFYSLEQVIKIIESIEVEETKVNNVTVTDIGNAIKRVITGIECGRIDILDRDSAEFGIGYDNTLTLENMDVDVDKLRAELEEELMPLGEVDESND
jgi:hypothetical protein